MRVRVQETGPAQDAVPMSRLQGRSDLRPVFSPGRWSRLRFMNANRTVKWMAIAAIVFGALTVLTGGRALFGSMESRADFGQAVPFVLWFNFLAGFVYIAAGAGLLLCRRWAVYTSLFIAVSTILVFVGFGVHVISGGAFERRTIGALTIRSLFWIGVTIVSIRAMKRTANLR